MTASATGTPALRSASISPEIGPFKPVSSYDWKWPRKVDDSSVSRPPVTT